MLQTAGKNRQVQRTCSWIFDAFMLLLDEKPYGKISISDISTKAGIARQTFYRNYNNKDDIASEYLKKTSKLSLEKTNGRNSIVLTFNYKYMLERRDSIVKLMSIVDIEHRLRDDAIEYPEAVLDQYRKKLSAKEYLAFKYKLFYQMTGCFHVFFDWFTHGMPLPLDTVVAMLNEMNTPEKTQYRNIPNITVRVE
jgi:AcrR family transcriptional regulator